MRSDVNANPSSSSGGRESHEEKVDVRRMRHVSSVLLDNVNIYLYVWCVFW